MMKKNPRALISVVWVKQRNLSFYNWYPIRLEKKTFTISKNTDFVAFIMNSLVTFEKSHRCFHYISELIFQLCLFSQLVKSLCKMNYRAARRRR